MFKLKSLRFVDGDEAYTISLIALYGLWGDVLVPLGEERVDVRCVLVDKVSKLIVERTEIGALSFDGIQTEDAIKTLNQFVERQWEQFCEMPNKLLG